MQDILRTHINYIRGQLPILPQYHISARRYTALAIPLFRYSPRVSSTSEAKEISWSIVVLICSQRSQGIWNIQRTFRSRGTEIKNETMEIRTAE